MHVLGIESTAHTFGVGIVDGRCSIRANEKAAFTTTTGGIHPRVAADHHFEHAKEVIERAMKKARITPKNVDAIAFSQGPGLGPCLEVGAIAARSLALSWQKPLVGVNHAVAHIEIAKKLTRARDPVVLYSSGANTQIIGLERGTYSVYGETLDTGVGNALDVFGRELGLGFPAGPILDRMYFESNDFVALPYSVKGMDLAFAGLVTAATRKIPSTQKPALAFSFVHTAFAMLAEVCERALAHSGKKELVVTGGVAASNALRNMLQTMCDERGARLCVPPADVCVDNGAMIAWTGVLDYRANKTISVKNSRVDQFWRVDDTKKRAIKQIEKRIK